MTRPRPRAEEMVTVNDPQLQALCSALAKANPGDVVVYHRGNLTCDAEHSAHIQAIRKVVWNEMARGSIHLLQRLTLRKGDASFYDYIAIKRKSG